MAVEHQFLAPFEIFRVNETRVNKSRAIVFDNCDNPHYLHFWINQEMGFPAKVTVLCRYCDASLFNHAFPGREMGRTAVLIEFASDEGIQFMKSYTVSMDNAVALVE